MTRAAEKTEGYNGWTNYETWNVALWIGNEPDTEARSREMAREAWEESEGLSSYAKFTGKEIFTREERAALILEKQVKAWVEDELCAPDLGACMASDLLSAALSEVDWREIAENWLSDVDKTEDEDEDDA